jgi:hypothetical protein
MAVQLAFKFSQRPLNALLSSSLFTKSRRTPISARLIHSPNNITFEASNSPSPFAIHHPKNHTNLPLSLNEITRPTALQNLKIQKCTSQCTDRRPSCQHLNFPVPGESLLRHYHQQHYNRSARYTRYTLHQHGIAAAPSRQELDDVLG